MDKLLAMRCFIRAVETGSFSAVAREMGIGQPNVSRHVAALEKSLGTRLLHRSTRQMTTTPEGQRYYAQARHALDIIAQAESEAHGEQDPHGLLRVACSESLGIDVLMAALPAFLERYPHVDVELRLGDDYVDLVAEGVDVAIRGGVLKDSALRARRVGTSERIYVASSAYLEKNGTPQEPAALLRHQCIAYTLIGGGGGWPFRDGEVQVTGRLRLNNLAGIRGAVLQDLGIAYLPSWMMAEELRSGRVRAVLTAHAIAGTPLNAVFAAERLLPRRAAVFIDYIAALFAGVPGLNGSSLV